jgi:hypothetical protein
LPPCTDAVIGCLSQMTICDWSCHTGLNVYEILTVSAVDAHSTPSVITTYRGGPSPTGTDRSDGKDLTQALDSFANNFSAKMEHGETAREKLRLIWAEVQGNSTRLNMLRDLKWEYRQKEFFASNQAEKDFFHAEINSIVEEIDICMVEQRRLERARHGIP